MNIGDFIKAFFGIAFCGSILAVLAPNEKTKKSIGFLSSLFILSVILAVFSGIDGSAISFVLPEPPDVADISSMAQAEAVAEGFKLELVGYIEEHFGQTPEECVVSVNCDGSEFILASVGLSGVDSSVCEHISAVLPEQTRVIYLDGDRDKNEE